MAYLSKSCQPYPTCGVSGWSTFPTDILLDIVGRLHTLQDFFAVRAVCRNWRNVAQLSPSTLSSQSPLLLVTHAERLYDFTSRRCYSLRFPWDLPDRFTIAFSHGHLVTITASDADNEIHLWDLFTGATTVLPPSPHFSRVAFLSARPNSAHCQVVLYDYNVGRFQYLNVGDTQWTVVSSPHWPSIPAQGFFKGELLALNRDMELLALELMDDSITVHKLGGGRVAGLPTATLQYVPRWLGECDGMLLAVCMHPYKILFTVCQWNSEKKEWKQINDLGDKALFVGCGRRVYSVSISSTGLELRKNCIYWACYENVHVFSLEDRSRKVLEYDPTDLHSSGIWVFPNQC